MLVAAFVRVFDAAAHCRRHEDGLVERSIAYAIEY